MTCTFFGHRNCPKEIQPILESTIIDLIENKNVKNFYVGNNGEFDSMVSNTLCNLSKKYCINHYVVLSYVPSKNNLNQSTAKNTVLPEGIETVPPKFAICWRNKWMIKQSDYVVTFVRFPFGGAAQFKELAEKHKKTVINLKTE